MSQEILLRIVKTWHLNEKPEYRDFRCANCQKNMRKAWHHLLAEGGYKTPVHFCNKCESDYKSSNVDTRKPETVVDINRFGLKFPGRIEKKLRTIGGKLHANDKNEYKTFVCDDCGSKMHKAYHVWFNTGKLLIEVHLCKKCGDNLNFLSMNL